jgi:hypothetical protein
MTGEGVPMSGLFGSTMLEVAIGLVGRWTTGTQVA